MRPSLQYLVIARGSSQLLSRGGGGANGGKGGAMEMIWGLLIDGGLAGVRVSFLAGARSLDLGPMSGSQFLA